MKNHGVLNLHKKYVIKSSVGTFMPQKIKRRGSLFFNQHVGYTLIGDFKIGGIHYDCLTTDLKGELIEFTGRLVCV